ncbi:MAG: SpoIIE family protein phosphatase [Candidatus Eremiobacteraeota bacterium]|nr:SpoIIE family protein phosphatase [Candidatus Eremiobacteraeota bacterium]
MDTIAESQRVLANALPVLVMMSDPDGVVNFFNDAWFQYTGQPRFKRDVTEEWREYIHPDDVAGVGAAWGAAMTSGADVVVEYRIRHADSGEWRWFSAQARALRDASGKIVQWIGTAMEIHHAREAQEALETLYRQQREVAETFQQAALPRSLPKVPGIAFDAVYEPSSRELQVGGDWYDAFVLADGSVAICVGDVNGHGLDAAVLMSKLRQSVRAMTVRAAQFQNNDPASIITSVEDMMSIEDDDLMASAFFGIIDVRTRTMRFTNAGHPPALLLQRDGAIETLRSGDTPLGWRFDVERQSREISLGDASALVCYTDGLIEASRDLLEGERRLHAALRDCTAPSVAEPSRCLLRQILDDASPDDVAILTLAFT